MIKRIVQIYRFIFARTAFYKFNKLLFRCSLSGLGILNFENDSVSGELYFIKKNIKNKKKLVVFDVGANVGRYSRNIYEVNNHATVYAFEPHPYNFDKLKELFDGKDNFYLFNAAAGLNASKVNLYDYEESDGSSHASLYKDVIECLHGSKSISHKVNVVRIDDIAKEYDVDVIDLLKIDTEGHELEVLKGAFGLINGRKIKAIHFEFNEMNVSSRVFFRDFWNILEGYEFYRLLPREMVRIDKYNPLFCELFAYQNIVALLRDEMLDS